MKFAKPALSIDQQIDQLKRRGLNIADDDRARHYLRHISYYRLRAYWLPEEVSAETPGDHAFRPGADFDRVIALYSFDRKLRLLVMDAIERVEVSLRTQWAHVLAVRYGPHAYLDADLFRNQSLYRTRLDKLRREYSDSLETFANHYRDTYTEPDMPPIWAISELLSFGDLSLWYKNLAKGEDRVEIAKPYGIDEQILKSVAHHLTYVRNVCAHHRRLWNREMTIQLKVPRNPEWFEKEFNADQPKSLYNTMVMLKYLLNIISPTSRWAAQLKALLKKHDSVDRGAMGFKAGWNEQVVWREELV